jgi:hypothetical protein
MPGDRHEVPLLLLQERPELLAELLALTGSKRLTNLSVVNTAVRFADVAGINPDLVFRSKEIPWVVLELQHAVDPDKRRIWPLIVTALLQQNGAMGDIVVLTASQRVATWAKEVACEKGPLGSTLSLVPVVLHIDLALAEQLVACEDVDLAVLAAWAIQARFGPRALSIARAAIARTEKLRGPLRIGRRRAMFQMFSAKMLAFFEELLVREADLPESRGYREWKKKHFAKERAEGRTKGLAQGLALLFRLYARRLGRELTEQEHTTLRVRLDSLGPDRLGDVLDLDGTQLAEWLADPEAK